MLLWAALLIVSAIYLHAIDPLPQNASGFRKLWKGVGVIAVADRRRVAGGCAVRRPRYPSAAGRAARRERSRLARGARPPRFERVRSVAELDQKHCAGRWTAGDAGFLCGLVRVLQGDGALHFHRSAGAGAHGRMVLLQADVTAKRRCRRRVAQAFQLFGPPGTSFFGLVQARSSSNSGDRLSAGREVLGALDAALARVMSRARQIQSCSPGGAAGLTVWRYSSTRGRGRPRDRHACRCGRRPA